MLRRLFVVCLVVLFVSGSVYSQDKQQDEQMMAEARKIAQSVHDTESIILKLNIEEAINELQFIIGELTNLSTDKVTKILKMIDWPGLFRLEKDPETTTVGAQMFGGGTGFDLTLVNDETGERVTFNLVKSPMVQSILQLANLPFATGGQKRKRVGSHKGLEKDGGRTLDVAYGGVHLGSWKYVEGSGKAGEVLMLLAKFFGGEPYSEISAAMQ
ncbi:hypothetical protein MJD09_11380 [bacterium]|nr:hypothetical protein [bacterium]